MQMPYRTLDKMSQDKRDLIADDSQRFFRAIDNHDWV